MERRILIYEPYKFLVMLVFATFILTAFSTLILYISNQAFFPQKELFDNWKKTAYIALLFCFSFIFIIILLRKKLFYKVHISIVTNSKQSDIEYDDVFWINLERYHGNEDINVYLNENSYSLTKKNNNDQSNNIHASIFIIPKYLLKHIVIHYCNRSYVVPLNGYENNIIINLSKDKNE